MSRRAWVRITRLEKSMSGGLGNRIPWSKRFREFSDDALKAFLDLTHAKFVAGDAFEWNEEIQAKVAWFLNAWAPSPEGFSRWLASHKERPE